MNHPPGVRQFATVEECIEDTEAAALRCTRQQWLDRVERNRQSGALSVQCDRCLRWVWPEERCNLFVQNEGEARPVPQ